MKTHTKQASAALAAVAAPKALTPTSAPVIEWLGGGFGFCPASGEWFTANDTALAVLGWQREGLAAEAILDRLTDTFDVSRPAAQRDLETFYASGMGRLLLTK